MIFTVIFSRVITYRMQTVTKIINLDPDTIKAERLLT